MPAGQVAFNSTVRDSTGVAPFETMTSENPLRALYPNLKNALDPSITPPMIKISQQLFDRAAVHIMRSQAPQIHYAGQKRKRAEF